MQIIKVSQTQDREAWLELRRGVITGSKAKKVAAPKRGNKTPAGVYELLADQLAIAKDGEPERDRGLRLENEALLLTQDRYNLDLNLDAGLWLSDDGKRGVSPDAAQVSDTPRYAAEAKCLDSKNHLQAIINDYEAKQLDDYNPVNSLRIGNEDYSYQVIQYFMINDNLEQVYFTLYDDRIVLENVMHYVIVIERQHVIDRVTEQEVEQRAVINQVNKMIEILKGVNQDER